MRRLLGVIIKYIYTVFFCDFIILIQTVLIFIFFSTAVLFCPRPFFFAHRPLFFAQRKLFAHPCFIPTVALQIEILNMCWIYIYIIYSIYNYKRGRYPIAENTRIYDPAQLYIYNMCITHVCTHLWIYCITSPHNNTKEIQPFEY